MLKNYLKIALRNIKRHKVYSLINILGLAVGMACAILILLWIQDELSYDSFHDKADRIYRVESAMNFSGQGEFPSVWSVAPAQLAPAILEEYPEVENTVRLTYNRRMLVQYGQTSFYERGFYFASPSIFDIFTFHFLKGDPISSFQDPFTIVISEEMSKKYFNEENPIGKTFNINKKYSFTVTGVIKNIPRNSHFNINFLSPFQTCEALPVSPEL